MKDDKYIRSLSASMIPLPEYDDDEDTDNPPEDPEIEADEIDIVDHIGTPEFKDIYLNCNYFFKRMEISKQIDFCDSIISRIEEVHEYKFPFKIYINSVSDLNNFYNFLEFLEFRNIGFTQLLLKDMVEDLRKINPKEFVEENWDKLNIRSIEISKKTKNQFISDFLVTNSRENLISFFSRCIEKNMLDVTIKNLEKKENRNG